MATTPSDEAFYSADNGRYVNLASTRAIDALKALYFSGLLSGLQGGCSPNCPVSSGELGELGEIGERNALA